MTRYCTVFVLWAGAFAQERPLPNPEILKWQAEAQARERAVHRRVENQIEKARATQPAPRPNRTPLSRRAAVSRGRAHATSAKTLRP